MASFRILITLMTDSYRNNLQFGIGQIQIGRIALKGKGHLFMGCEFFSYIDSSISSVLRILVINAKNPFEKKVTLAL